MWVVAAAGQAGRSDTHVTRHGDRRRPFMSWADCAGGEPVGGLCSVAPEAKGRIGPGPNWRASNGANARWCPRRNTREQWKMMRNPEERRKAMMMMRKRRHLGSALSPYRWSLIHGALSSSSTEGSPWMYGLQHPERRKAAGLDGCFSAAQALLCPRLWTGWIRYVRRSQPCTSGQVGTLSNDFRLSTV